MATSVSKNGVIGLLAGCRDEEDEVRVLARVYGCVCVRICMYHGKVLVRQAKNARVDGARKKEVLAAGDLCKLHIGPCNHR